MKQNMLGTIFNFRLTIHTVQMLSNELPLPLEAINTKPYIIKPKVRQTDKGCLYPLNANKANSSDIINLKTFSRVTEGIKGDLGISKWYFDRVDVAFDTVRKYDEIYKYSLYMILLLSIATNIKNAISIKDVFTKQKRALSIKKDGYNAFEILIYDKDTESKHKYPYSRFEFRYKNLCTDDICTVFDKLKRLIKELPKSKHIKHVEQQRIKDLYNLWNMENRQGSINFSEFVRKHDNDILTRNIAKGLYEKIHNGKFDNWLKKFRQKNTISFITEIEIKCIANEMQAVLDNYINN